MAVDIQRGFSPGSDSILEMCNEALQRFVFNPIKL
jgi:hypothetical protein